MSKATFTPAKTETKVIEVVPAKVTLELTVEETRHIRTLLAHCNSIDVRNVFPAVDNKRLLDALDDHLDALKVDTWGDYVRLKSAAIRYQ
jgi:hypothetical protein